jgi:hypothetical protein
MERKHARNIKALPASLTGLPDINTRNPARYDSADSGVALAVFLSRLRLE